MHIKMELDEQSLRKCFTEVQNKIHRAVSDGVYEAVTVGTMSAVAGQFQDRTGYLRLSINGQLQGWSGSWFWGFIHSPAQYTSFVEFPTKPHDIWPKAGYNLNGPVRSGQTRRASGKGPHEYIVGRGRFLRWKGPGGQEFFARMVHHPGTAGFFFMRYAELVARRKLEEAVWATIARNQY